MNKKHKAMEFLMTFMVVTACITILEGILGVLFLPEERFGYEAFFSPPVFGFLSALSGLFLQPGKNAGLRQAVIKKAVHLVLIEGMVFGINCLSGSVFSKELSLALAASVFLVFVLVNLTLWGNDRRSAELFNERLKAFQQEHAGGQKGDLQC